tara:strand:- start:473 stop:955 length:483 start_codon:yes stop_codon:yes gene_type:complete
MKSIGAVMVMVMFYAFPASAQDADPAVVESCFVGATAGETTPSCIGQAANECQMRGYTTTLGITQCIQAETQEWDVLLNREYKATRADFANRDNALSANSLDLTDQLLKAQRAWIAFRDAECALAYARWQDGSIRSVVHANCMMVMTASRAIELRDMKGN